MNDVWRYDANAGTCTAIATRPGGAETIFSDAVYDSVRDQLLVLGVDHGTLVLDAMSLPFPSWSRLWSAPPGDGQRPAGIAIDTRRDRLVLLGQWDADSTTQRVVRIPLSDPGAWTVAWSHGTWVPDVRPSGSAVYDERHDRFFVVLDSNDNSGMIGFWSPTAVLATVSADGAPDWAPVPLGPAWGPGDPRAIALDDRSNRLLLVDEYAGAWSLPTDGGDAVRLDDGTRVVASDRRFGVAASFDPTAGRLRVSGGADLGLSLPMFMSMPVEAPPGAPVAWTSDAPGSGGSRWFHSLLLDPVGNRLVIAGGSTRPDNFLSGPPTSVHSLNAISGWQQVEPEGHGGRGTFGGAYGFVRDQNALIAFGGMRFETGGLDDTLRMLPLDGGDWQALHVDGTEPPARRWAQFFFDAYHDRFILLGGDDLNTALADAWELRMRPTPAWRPLVLAGEALAPYSAIFPDDWRGGAWAISRTFRDGVFRPISHLTFRADTILVSAVPTLGDEPNPTWQMTGFCFDPLAQRLIGFLNVTDDVYFTNLYEVRLGAAAHWHALPVSGTLPMNRGLFSTVFDPDGNRLFLYGGYDDNQDYRADTWQLQFFDAPTPVAISLASATADERGAHLRWRLGTSVANAGVERSRDDVTWEPLGAARASGEDLLFDDGSLAPGESAAYRLRVLSGSEAMLSEVVWVTAPARMPERLSLRVLGSRVGDVPSVLVSSAPGAEARLSLLDVSGRRIESVRLPGGTRTHAFARRPVAGLYFALLTQGDERRVARVVIAP